MKSDTPVVDDRPAIDFYWTPDEMAAIVATSAGATRNVIDGVAWMAATDLLAGHHPLIPFHQVRDDIAVQLYGSARTYTADHFGKTWTWCSLVHEAVMAADDHLFQGRAYEYAERNGVATTRTRVGRIITERAAAHIWPKGTALCQRVNPNPLCRYTELREAREFVMYHALAYIEGHTGKAPARRDEGVFDLLDDATAKALLDRLAVIALPAN
ncbi:hypothetical protein [Nonomuraea maritima]|nr:hypothetical protein [Nonomuraea maritima]